MRMPLDDLLDRCNRTRPGHPPRMGAPVASAIQGAPSKRRRPCTPPRPLKRCASASWRAVEQAHPECAVLSAGRRASTTIGSRQMKSVGGVSEREAREVMVQPTARLPIAAGDDGDAGRQRPHRVAEGRAVGVMQTPFAHALASIRSSSAPTARTRRRRRAWPQRTWMILPGAFRYRPPARPSQAALRLYCGGFGARVKVSATKARSPQNDRRNQPAIVRLPRCVVRR